MKKIIHLIVLSCIVFLLSCEADKKEDDYTPPPIKGQKEISAGGKEKGTLSYDSSEQSSSEAASPLVELSEDHVLLNTFNLNLDLDRSEEQVLLYKERENPDSNIFVAAADFDLVRNSYVLPWKSKTGAVTTRTFSISFDDIIGDHTIELICIGTNNKGEQTIDVFHKTQPPSGVGLYYAKVLSVETDGSIEINQFQRSEAYKLGQKNGKSYTITVYSHDSESDNHFDLEKRTYFWQYQSERYVLGNVEKLPGKNVEEEQLQELLSEDENTFKQFLNGAWYKTGSEKIEDFILFDSETQQITLFSDNLAEIFQLKSSYRTRIKSTMFIIGYNTLVPFIEKQISVTLLSLNSISVSVRDTDFQKGGNQWDGTYVKVTDSLTESIISNYQPEKKHVINPIKLSGSFSSSAGVSMLFNFPHFRFKDGNNVKTGGYTVFNMETPVLQMKVLGEDGIVKEKHSYSVDYDINESNNRIVHTLVLTPGKITSHGFQESGSDALHLEKIEIIQEE